MKNILSILAFLVAAVTVQADSLGNYPVSNSPAASDYFLTIYTNGDGTFKTHLLSAASLARGVNNGMPVSVSPVIQPGGIFCMGDSLNAWFLAVTGTNYWATACASNAVPAGVATFNANGMNFFYYGGAMTNISWWMNVTNKVAVDTGWYLPLDNGCCVPGSPDANIMPLQVNQSYYVGYQNWSSSYGGKYPSSGASTFGTNTLFLTTGCTNKIVFGTVANNGTTNDLFMIFGGTNYYNLPTTNVYYFNVGGAYGGNVGIQLVGVSNSVMSVNDYIAFGRGTVQTSEKYYPPFFTQSQGNDPLIYLTNESPMVTGIPKAFFYAISQNSRLLVEVNNNSMLAYGTNGSPAFIDTNACANTMYNANYVYTAARNTGYWPVIGGNIPVSYLPSLNSYDYQVFTNLNYYYSQICVSNLDYFYDWNATNNPYTNNASYYLDNVHPGSTGAFPLTQIWSTNFWQFFNLKRTAILLPR